MITTIDELNKNPWYRAAKVIFVIFVLIIFIIGNKFIIDKFKPEVDYQKGYWLCSNGMAIFDLDRRTTNSVLEQRCSGDYKFVEVYSKDRNWIATIIYELCFILLITVISEILRIIIYYIVFGKFFIGDFFAKKKIIKNDEASSPLRSDEKKEEDTGLTNSSRLDEKRENKINSAKNVMDIGTKKIIATLLYLLLFIIEIKHIFSLADNNTAALEKYSPNFIVIFTLLYFMGVREKNQSKYRPFYKSYLEWFIIISLIQITTYLLSFILLGKIVYFEI